MWTFEQEEKNRCRIIRNNVRTNPGGILLLALSKQYEMMADEFLLKSPFIREDEREWAMLKQYKTMTRGTLLLKFSKEQGINIWHILRSMSYPWDRIISKQYEISGDNFLINFLGERKPEEVNTPWLFRIIFLDIFILKHCTGFVSLMRNKLPIVRDKLEFKLMPFGFLNIERFKVLDKDFLKKLLLFINQLLEKTAYPFTHPKMKMIFLYIRANLMYGLGHECQCLHDLKYCILQRSNSWVAHAARQTYCFSSTATVNYTRATIYVWRPNRRLKRKTGHIAMRTYIGGKDNSGYYISFWPSQGVGKNNFFRKFPGYLSESLEKDEELEGDQPPDETINLYDLNVIAINKEFEKFKTSNFIWSVFSSIVKRKTHQTCCGLVVKLLGTGGITPFEDHFYRDVIGIKTVLKVGSVTVLDALNIVKHAQQYEKKHLFNKRVREYFLYSGKEIYNPSKNDLDEKTTGYNSHDLFFKKCCAQLTISMPHKNIKICRLFGLKFYEETIKKKGETEGEVEPEDEAKSGKDFLKILPAISEHEKNTEKKMKAIRPNNSIFSLYSSTDQMLKKSFSIADNKYYHKIEEPYNEKSPNDNNLH